MILRKPFAILIKYFRLIHVILTVLSFYLLYRTNSIISFFSEYMGTNNSVIGKDLTEELYTVLMYISLFIIIIGIIIIMGLMLFKHKKIKLYIFNVLTYIFVVVVYAISYSVLSSLEIELVDVRTLKMVQDLLITIFALQIASFFSLMMRATGFDVKKFDFKEDLKELEIEEKDNEEFEINVDLSSDETKRKINRALRHAKYAYKENKYIIWAIAGITTYAIIVAVYLNFRVYNKVYNKGDTFSTTNFTMSLGDSYITNQNYRGVEILSEQSFVSINLTLKNNTAKEMEFSTARLALKIDEHSFYPQNDYDEKLIDLGNIYNKQMISNEFTTYTFVYIVPSGFLDKNMKLVYNDYNNDTIKINVKPQSLLTDIIETEYNIGDEIDFKNSIFDGNKIKITNIEMAPKFKVEYNYCIQEECYPSYEYIRPEYKGNTNKGMMKIVGEISLDEKETRISNLYTIINKYGYLEYGTSNQLTKSSATLQKIEPIKTKLTNEYYIEIPSEALNTDKIDLVIQVRNYKYRIHVK